MSTVKITVGPVWARIVGEVDHEIAVALCDALSAMTPGARYSRAVQWGTWDGKTKFFRPGSHTFPSGLTRRVVKLIQTMKPDVGVSLFFEGGLAVPQPRVPTLSALHGIVLHSHQVEGAATAVRYGRCVLEIGMSGGKTAVGAEIIRLIDLPTLWLIHRTQLVEQTATELERFLGTPVGRLHGTRKNVTGFDVVVGTVQTLNKIRKTDTPFWRRWGMLIIDECHLSSSNSWYEVANRCEAAWFRFGLSGTALTGDPVKDLRMEAATGPVIPIIGVRELAEQQHVAQAEVHLHRLPTNTYPTWESVRDTVCPSWRENPRRLVPLGGRLFAETYNRGITGNPFRNAYIASLVRERHAADRVLVLVTRVDHGRTLFDVFASHWRRFGLYTPVFFLHGGNSLQERLDTIETFQRSLEGAVLIASPIFDAGVNIPEIDAGLFAGGGESPILVGQRAGRFIRKRPDKERVILHDFWDGLDPYGRPHKADYLAHHSKARIETYRRLGFDLIEEIVSE